MNKTYTTLTEKELGIVEAVLVDFNNHRLPRLLNLKSRVGQGEKLSDHDINFLNELFELSKGSDRFAEHHSEFRALVDRAANLYQSITSKALENEKK